MSQLSETLGFASNDLPSAALTERVGLGLFGLQEYSNEYWIFHVLRYFEAYDGPFDQRSPLLTQLSRFATKLTEMAKTQPSSLSGLSESSSNVIPDRVSERLQAVPEIHNLICQVLDFRQNFDTKQASEGPGKSGQCGQ